MYVHRAIPILIARCVKRAICTHISHRNHTAQLLRFNIQGRRCAVEISVSNGISNRAIRHEKSSHSHSRRHRVAYRVLNFSLRPDQPIYYADVMLVPIINDLSSRVYLWSRRIAEESSRKKPTADFQDWPQGPSHISARFVRIHRSSLRKGIYTSSIN